MRRYIEHIKNTRAPHERRQHAMQVAGVLTAGIFALWLGTLGLRLSNQGVAQTGESGQPDQTLTAAAAANQADLIPHLEVSTTSVYSQ